MSREPSRAVAARIAQTAAREAQRRGQAAPADPVEPGDVALYWPGEPFEVVDGSRKRVIEHGAIEVDAALARRLLRSRARLGLVRLPKDATRARAAVAGSDALHEESGRPRKELRPRDPAGLPENGPVRTRVGPATTPVRERQPGDRTDVLHSDPEPLPAATVPVTPEEE